MRMITADQRPNCFDTYTSGQHEERGRDQLWPTVRQMF